MPDGFVRKYLDLSTAHIPGPITAKIDTAEETVFNAGPHRVEAIEYGWIVFLADVDIDPGDDDTPDWFRPIETLAKQEGCLAILFDRDAGQHPDLPAYTW